jgi:hypothetical protein
MAAELEKRYGVRSQVGETAATGAAGRA